MRDSSKAMIESSRRADDRRLTVAEKARLALDIVQSYTAMRWWLLREPLPNAVATARRTTRAHAQEQPLSMASAFRLGRAVQKTLRVLPFDTKCLIRSLVLIRILARRGFDASLVIGVRSDPEFQAHAWVEADGVALLPTGSGFHRLTEM